MPPACLAHKSLMDRLPWPTGSSAGLRPMWLEERTRMRCWVGIDQRGMEGWRERPAAGACLPCYGAVPAQPR